MRAQASSLRETESRAGFIMVSTRMAHVMIQVSLKNSVYKFLDFKKGYTRTR